MVRPDSASKARSRGAGLGERGDGAGGGPDECVHGHEGEDDAGAQREAHVGAEVLHAELCEDGGGAGNDRGEHAIDDTLLPDDERADGCAQVLKIVAESRGFGLELGGIAQRTGGVAGVGAFVGVELFRKRSNSLSVERISVLPPSTAG